MEKQIKMSLMIFLSCMFYASPSTCLATPIFDSHTHVSSDPDLFPLNAAELMAKMDHSGVMKAFVLGLGFAFSVPQRVREENDFLAAQVATHIERLYGFCSVPVVLEDWIFEEIQRCKTLGLTGLKLHLEFSETDLGHPQWLSRYEKILEQANTLNFPVVVHAFVNDEQSWKHLLFGSLQSGAKVIFAHGLNKHYRLFSDFFYFEDKSVLSNLYVEISVLILQFQNAPLAIRQEVVWYLRFVGVDNILFGSDYPAYSMEQSISALEAYSEVNLGSVGFSEKEFEKIRFQNAEKIIQSAR